MQRPCNWLESPFAAGIVRFAVGVGDLCGPLTASLQEDIEHAKRRSQCEDTRAQERAHAAHCRRGACTVSTAQSSPEDSMLSKLVRANCKDHSTHVTFYWVIWLHRRCMRRSGIRILPSWMLPGIAVQTRMK